MSFTHAELERTEHPVDVVERIASVNDWRFDREDDDEIRRFNNLDDAIHFARFHNRAVASEKAVESRLSHEAYVIDGMKVIVCKLKPNPLGYTSVAYPVDELRLPKWFQELPFDHSEMEAVIINNKIENLIGVLEWDLNSTTETNTFGSLFDFE